MVLLMVGVFNGDRSLPLLTWAAVALYVVAGVLVVQGAGTPVLAFDGLYIADAFSSYFKLLILGAAAVAAVLALPYLKGTSSARFEYPVLLTLGVTGMCMMVSANDMLSLYVGLELQSLAAYVLAAFNRNETRSSEAGLKYFVLGALASGILLYGISLVYGFAGTTNFSALVRLWSAARRATSACWSGWCSSCRG
jgi:NADH-quinone oxidoreductase subunit N